MNTVDIEFIYLMYYKHKSNILPILLSPIYIDQSSLQFIELHQDRAASLYLIH